MADIYDQHRAAFANVAAYVILDEMGRRAATIAFKFPRDGAGRQYCYLHIFGGRMVRGFAGGYGYDKSSAAAADAAAKVKPKDYGEPNGDFAQYRHTAETMQAALIINGGNSWHRELESKGFQVLQAV